MLILSLISLVVLFIVEFVKSYGITECLSLDNAVNEKFEILHQWRYLNYTWPGHGDAYMKAIRENR